MSDKKKENKVRTDEEIVQFYNQILDGEMRYFI